MKLEEIQELWNRDRDIDISNLAVESVRIPQVHDKYLKIYIDERIKLKGLEFDLAKITRRKTNYYAGTMSQEELDANNLEPFQHKVLKTDMQTFLDADDDLQKVTAKILMNEEIENYLDKVLSEISNRRWTIRNMIEWLKFTNGVN